MALNQEAVSALVQLVRAEGRSRVDSLAQPFIVDLHDLHASRGVIAR